MTTLRLGRVESALGPVLVAESDRGVAAVGDPDQLPALLDGLERRFPGVTAEPAELDSAWLDLALGGGPLPAVDLRGLSAFDRRVYEVVRGIPSGETATYGEVAALVGAPLAARAVGGAMARCPLFPAVPCHRVVRAVDGWSGWGGDDRLKRRLLRAEAR
ncbi:MAG: methylated-DNA--[protein]-cysteine S-methyltransferase [Chloroflexi bacterium]|nr:methylated-DNA--[protein]-cysteine S-methyltransferase [Chloroflexota bacterium]